MGMNSDKYIVFIMFVDVYHVIYFDIFGDSFSPGMTALYVSDCKQTFRAEYELESYVFI